VIVAFTKNFLLYSDSDSSRKRTLWNAKLNAMKFARVVTNLNGIRQFKIQICYHYISSAISSSLNNA